MAAWPTTQEIEDRLRLPQGSADATELLDARDAAVEWVASRTGLEATADDIPAAVRLATLLYGVKFYRRRNTPDGLTDGDDLVTIRTSRYDGDAEQLLEPYLEVPHA